MNLKVSRILHAGYIFEDNGFKIVFDPIFENPFSHNCHAYPSVEFDTSEIKKIKFDAVFISHYHDDHCSFTSLNLIDRNTPIYIFCIHDEMFDLINQLGFKDVHSLIINKSVVIGGIEVITRKSLDADVDSIFHIKAAGLNILNVVDSWIDPNTLDQLSQFHWDLILWPFQTMREVEVLSPSRFTAADLEIPIEWVEQLQILKPRYIVPSSCQFNFEDWSWYNKAFFPITYLNFKNQMNQILPATEVIRLDPGVSVFLGQDSLIKTDSLSWIKSIGQQAVDYCYDAQVRIPKTSEISKNFLKLSKIETASVFDYCKTKILNKYRALDISEEVYFDQEVIWQLNMYDHLGVGYSLYYKIKSSEIDLLTEVPDRISWLTEISIYKLYSAIIMGEALTSLYIRINDIKFNFDTEKKIGSADVMADPLIRCLYSDSFGAYQKAQLQKLIN